MTRRTVALLLVMIASCSQNATTPTGKPPQSADKPATHDRSKEDLILDAVLEDIASNPQLKHEREFYGLPDGKEIALVTYSQYGVAWPKTYTPRLDGFVVHRVDGDSQDKDTRNKHRMLGVRIDKINLQEGSGFLDAPVEITILNGGGTKDGIIMGGCSVYYVPKQKGDHWTVEYSGSVSL